ncbi:DUF3300 domain-containing protein [Sinorhizobium meliloti]|uniref:DUF3300 domain-containing protein n=1 Tax=Rhizobium meliloti TaxID=382 RepID=UPI0004F83E94|nr:DUF3300 domain-containing protein [Sinorhizobium meliloti]AIM03720.1 hypothetical protein DU99_31645 [Sinorhizobium meliloti]MDW9441641.1 DUF3300 domain-containing protein [Sinorhizobium meliloti]MDW9516131.1 DUF3300 domain-containing protein [Sinorhizobium meliloti]MDW9530451.1 DUF3300 domain-containing protein [Sinorhizobium meliloti]MDW9572888.1 DUF3300 domain-containing protein [Sinorhizobium meliloti]
MPTQLLRLIARPIGVAGLTILMVASPTLVPRGLAQGTTQEAGAASEDQPDLLTEDELEIMVARIALYPDELVALVSSASLYPLQIVEAARFLEEKKTAKDLQPKTSWDDSVVSLLNYPEIVKMMSDDLDWTQALGSALAYQQKDVLVAIQTLRDKAVADGVIKTDEKVKVVNEGDNIVIQAADPEKIYVPRYEPEMLYEPGYAPAPVAYYPDPYPNYFYPSAPYFAAAITGAAIWAAAVDWDDWGVWGGHWDGDVDIDCDNCFNDIDIDRDKFKMNDVDWKNVDRSKIKFDKNQFANIDRDKFKNEFKANRNNNIANRARDVSRDRGDIARRPAKVSVDDIRKSKVDASRVRAERERAGDVQRRVDAPRRDGGAAVNRARASTGKAAGARSNVHRKAHAPKPGAHAHHSSGGKHSALGKVGNKRQTHISSNRGRHSMGGGHRGGGGGHKMVKRGGGRRR